MTAKTEDVPKIVRCVQERAAKIDTPESRRIGLSFQPRPTDVIITTAIKSGTTWVQQVCPPTRGKRLISDFFGGQICHGLRSRGDMNFEEIAAVIPMLEDAMDYGYGDLDKEQPAHPRMYKTHTAYEDCPKGAGKYIIVLREPKDVIVSFYHFLCGWLFEPNELGLEEFVRWFLLADCGEASPNAGQLEHIASWYPYRKDANKLWIHYEDLRTDLAGCVTMIAEFLGIDIEDKELLKLVEKQASFAFMKKHWKKFDDHLLKEARNEAAGLPKDAGLSQNGAKIRDGQSSGGNHLRDETRSKIDAKWQAVMEPLTGYSSYQDMRNGVNKELNRAFLLPMD